MSLSYHAATAVTSIWTLAKGRENHIVQACGHTVAVAVTRGCTVPAYVLYELTRQT